MSGYKEKFEAMKAAFLALNKSEEVEEKEVKLEEAPKEEKEAPVEEAAKPEYVTMAQFNELKAKQEEFMTSVTEMLTSAMEMLNPTEQNKVPAEMSKQEKKEELAAQPLVHDPESNKNNAPKLTRLGAGAGETLQSRVMGYLFGDAADTSIFETK